MRTLALAALAALACAPPSQLNPSRWGTVTVWFGPEDWASSYREEFRAELRALEALGPAFVESSDRTTAAVLVLHWDSGDGCTQGVEQWRGGREVYLDPVCAAGNLELRAAMGHGVGHALHMQHVCIHPGDAPDCSPVGSGYALMNPSLTFGDDPGPGTESAYTGLVPQPEPTELDLLEYLRTHPR